MKRSTLVLLILLGVFAIVFVVALKFKGGTETEVMVDVVKKQDVTASVSEAGSVQPPNRVENCT